jgi:hypothetical protein
MTQTQTNDGRITAVSTKQTSPQRPRFPVKMVIVGLVAMVAGFAGGVLWADDADPAPATDAGVNAAEAGNRAAERILNNGSDVHLQNQADEIAAREAAEAAARDAFQVEQDSYVASQAERAVPAAPDQRTEIEAQREAQRESTRSQADIDRGRAADSARLQGQADAAAEACTTGPAWPGCSTSTTSPYLPGSHNVPA